MAAPLQPATFDEALGLRAFAALLDGDLNYAACVLAAARYGYRLAFLCQLAVVVPSVALRLAWSLSRILHEKEPPGSLIGIIQLVELDITRSQTVTKCNHEAMSFSSCS